MQLCVRLVNGRDGDVQTLAKPDPTSTSHYKYPAVVGWKKINLITERKPILRVIVAMELPLLLYTRLKAQHVTCVALLINMLECGALFIPCVSIQASSSHPATVHGNAALPVSAPQPRVVDELSSLSFTDHQDRPTTEASQSWKGQQCHAENISTIRMQHMNCCGSGLNMSQHILKLNCTFW